MSFNVTSNHVCVWLSYFILFISPLRQGLVAGLWILLSMGVFPSCRGWIAQANCRVLVVLTTSPSFLRADSHRGATKLTIACRK